MSNPVCSFKSDKERFCAFLKFLLDETGLFSRSDWANYLDVKEHHIEFWLTGRLFPSPEKVRSVLRVLREADGIEGVEERLAMIENLPLVEITTIDRLQWRGVTLSEYLCLPLLAGLRRAMSGLTLAQREELIQSAADEAYKLKEK